MSRRITPARIYELRKLFNASGVSQLCDEVLRLQRELDDIYMAAGRPIPREKLTVAVQQWKEERDSFLWTIGQMSRLCKDALSST